MAKKPTTGASAKKTPRKFKQYKDARKNKGAGTYPNSYRYKTRAGHLFEFDSSKDAEHITIQHRSGSMIQFTPDGAVHYLSHNGQQNIVFGENRIYVTGAHDLVVDGDYSNKTQGDHNETTEGGKYMSTGGPTVQSTQSVNIFAEKQFDMQSDSATLATSSGMTLSAGKTMSISGTEGTTVGSGSAGLAMRGETAGLHGREATVVESVGQVSVYSSSQVAIDGKGGGVYINCGKCTDVQSTVKL